MKTYRIKIQKSGATSTRNLEIEVFQKCAVILHGIYAETFEAWRKVEIKMLPVRKADFVFGLEIER